MKRWAESGRATVNRRRSTPRAAREDVTTSRERALTPRRRARYADPMKRTRVSATGLALVTALGLATPACTVSGSGTIGVEATTPTLVYDAPPAPRVETVAARPGFVWVNGHWIWQDGRWQWLAGHWERERAGYVWTAGHWERQGNGWHWIAGSWTVSSGPATVTVTTTPTEPAGPTTVVTAYPTSAPPPPRVENVLARPGFVWVPGRWDWRAGQWAWVAGHWERERANQMWIAGSWQLEGGHYVWIEGHWGAAAERGHGPVVRDHRR